MQVGGTDGARLAMVCSSLDVGRDWRGWAACGDGHADEGSRNVGKAGAVGQQPGGRGARRHCVPHNMQVGETDGARLAMVCSSLKARRWDCAGAAIGHDHSGEC